MRLSLATAASVALAAALLAGCSGSSQGTSALPGGPSTGSQSASHGSPVSPDMVKGRMTPEKLLKLQAKGTLVAGIPQKAVRRH